MEISSVSSNYIWNKGLPKAYCKKDWIYYTCDECFKEKKKKPKVCCFIFTSSKIYAWWSEKAQWKNMNFILNPSRRDSMQKGGSINVKRN